MANLSKVIYINEEDYSTLLNGGTITKGGVTYSHDPTALYVIKNVSAPEYAETAGYATAAGQATKATQDGGGNVISDTYAKKAIIGTLTYNSQTDTWTCNKTHEQLRTAMEAGYLVYLEYDNMIFLPRTYSQQYQNSGETYYSNLKFFYLGTYGYYVQVIIYESNIVEYEEIDFESYLNTEYGDSWSAQQEIITLGETNSAPTFTDRDNNTINHASFRSMLNDPKREVILKVQTGTDIYHYYYLFVSEKISLSVTNYRFISFPATSTVECIELAYNSSNNTFQRGGSNISLQTLIDSNNKLSADYIQDGTNNKVFSAADKTKLDGIATGAEVNVQANWTETDTNSDAYIQNKPTIPTVNDGTLTIKQNSISRGTFTANQSGSSEVDIKSIVYGKYISGNFRKGTLSGSTWSFLASNLTLEEGVLYIDVETKKVYYYDGTGLKETYSPNLSPYANVQADWNETDDTSDAYIWNKPTIPNTLKVGSVAGKLYRNTVGGAGNFSISGNSGCIPNLTAGTFLVAIYAHSSTQSYKFRFNFGSVTYDLETTNGEISDLRTITISSASTFSGSVVGTSVASGTILYVVMYDYLTPVTTVGPAAVTNRYADLDGTPTLPSASNTTPLLVRGSSGSAGSSGAYARADHKHAICKNFVSYSSLVADTDAQLGEIRYDSDEELFYIYDANNSNWVRLDNKDTLPLIIDITYNNDTYICNKTNAEIYKAWQAGRDVYVRRGGEYLYPLASEPGSTFAYFMGPRYDELGVFDRIYISTVNSTQQVTTTNMIMPSPGSSNPQMDGTASPGAANTTTYSKSDHVHPSDTSRVPTSRTINGHALSSDLYLTVFGNLGSNGFERDTVNNQGAWAGAEIVTPDPYTTYIDIIQNKLYRYNPVVGGGSYVEVGSSGTGSLTSGALTNLTDIL